MYFSLKDLKYNESIKYKYKVIINIYIYIYI